MSTELANADDPERTAPSGLLGDRTGLVSGAVLAGRYEVDRLIGEGGMGDVYLAKHLKIDKKVAIKVLAPEQMRRPRAVSRFLQEAKATSKIRHDNVVDITDFGEVNGRAFFVMEYFEGEDLHFMLKREGQISWERAQGIAIQLLEGLSAAHQVGIIHRDVKPHNCFITPRENNVEFVKVIDFGIAKLRDGADEQLTRTGAIMGTAEYMSPEQGQGAELDGRSDLYSVGVILYRMLVGRVPFAAGNAMAILYQHVNAVPKPVSEAAPDAGFGERVDALVAKALAKDPDERFATAREFVDALKAIDEAGAGMHPGRTGRSRLPIAAAAVAALALGGGIAVWASESGERALDTATASVSVAVASAPKARAESNLEGRPPSEKPPEPEPRAEPEPEPEVRAVEKVTIAATDSGDGPNVDAADADTATAIPGRRSAREVQAVLARLASKVSACGEKGGLFPGEKVSVKLTIGPSGKPGRVSVTGKQDAAGEACIRKVIRRARFGEARRSQSAEKRFTI